LKDGLRVVPVRGIPDVHPGDDLGALVVSAIVGDGERLAAGDVVVVAQKVVSKAEGRVVRLGDVEPSARATEWAAAYGKDARVVETVLREARRIVRMERGVLIAETVHGFICANAGVDASNVPAGCVTLLPLDPDASAEGLRVRFSGEFGVPVGVIVADTFGRPWREGAVNVAIGVAGLRPLLDYRGCADRYGRRLQSTIIAVADELASAAELVMQKTSRTPAAIISGADCLGEGSSRALVRAASQDLFR